MSEFKEFESKFDEWWEENYMNVSADRAEAFDIYSLGLKHQQAKVEELQKQVTNLDSRATQYALDEMATAKLNGELQKRVDLVKRELKAAKEGHYGFNDEGADIDSFIFDLEQALKGEGTPNINIDEKGECRHFSTTMFHEGKAECFHCDAVVNEDREVIGKQSKGFSWAGKEHKK